MKELNDNLYSLINAYDKLKKALARADSGRFSIDENVTLLLRDFLKTMDSTRALHVQLSEQVTPAIKAGIDI